MKMRRMPRFPLELLSEHERKIFYALRTPKQIQGFIDTLIPNREEDGPTLQSVRETLKSRKAHCIEAALLAAAALWFSGSRPLLVDLRARGDDDHVIAVFRAGLYWGAISKTSSATLRYRDPVYRSIRELVMSYFHEYTNNSGTKTLAEYSRPYDISRVPPELWLTGGMQCWEIGARLDDLAHIPLAPRSVLRGARPIDAFTRRVLLLREDD